MRAQAQVQRVEFARHGQLRRRTREVGAHHQRQRVRMAHIWRARRRLQRTCKERLRGRPVEGVAVRERSRQHQRFGVQRLQRKRPLHSGQRHVHTRPWRLQVGGHQLRPGAGNPSVRGGAVGRGPHCGLEALQRLAMALFMAQAQEVVATFDELGRRIHGAAFSGLG